LDTGLRYVPALDLGNLDLLRELGVKGYLTELEHRYPNWKRFESLDERDRANFRISRNLEEWYWEQVKDGRIDFPVLPGQWLSVETVAKPPMGDYRSEHYALTQLERSLDLDDPYYNRYISWYKINNAINKKKGAILSEVGLTRQRADVRLLEALEGNLLSNREGWGKSPVHEWRNTAYRHSSGAVERLFGGGGSKGAARVVRMLPQNDYGDVGYRTAIALAA
jgi:hypothetical protein